jgi:ABC-type transport system involved in Fe-S cluster assembly fused permease/ATPase subunit
MLNDARGKIKILTKLYLYLWPKDWGIRGRFLMAGIFLLAAICLNIGVPLVLREVINAISTPKSALFLAEFLLISYGALWTLAKVIEQLRLIAMNRVVERGIRLLTLDIFENLTKLSLRYHSDRKTGGIVNAVDRAQYAFPRLVWGLFLFIIPTLLEIVLASVTLVWLYGAIYGIILAAILIIFIFFTLYATTWSVNALRIANEKSSQTTTKMVDSILNYETIRYFCNQKYEYDQCNNFLAEREDATTRQHARVELVMLGQGIIMGIGLIILTWLSGIKVMSGVFQIGDFILINAYLLQFMIPLGNFGHVFRDVNEGLTNLEEVMEIFNEKPEVQDITNAKALMLNKGSVSFDKVSFGYDERRPILKEISFELPAKKTTAIVGATGSGKSTIANLLFRYYDVLNGCITVDGQDIREVSQLSLQSVIGIVSQNTALFNDTLRYNIAYGLPDASEAEIEKAIKNSHLDLLLASLPDGLNTIVGEHGFKLSGGERQRVAIARVLLKNPAIFVFDEATSSLDTKTEHVIQQNIEEISRNATTLIIAHRLSTVIHADQILVLDHGILVELGNHDELLKQGGLYAQLWAKQTREKPDTK